MNKTEKLLLNRSTLQINMLADWLKSPLFHMVCLFTISIVVFLQYGINQQPILGNRAYFIYMAQVVYRGNSLYGQTTFGYTPYGPLLSALTMHIGKLFNLPSYLAPRYLSIIIVAINSCLLYLIVRNASGSTLLGMISGLILSGFGLMGKFAVSNLEPKTMVVFFMLISMLALQRRNWTATGCACAIASMFWQPAIIITMVMIIILIFQGGDTFWSRFIRFLLGMFLGLLPALLYLTAYHEWNNFILLAVFRKAVYNLPHVASHPFRWLVICRKFKSEVFIFIFAAVAFCGFIIKQIVRKNRDRVNILIDNKNAGLILLTVAWSLFNSMEFEGVPDLIPLLPLVSYWSALFIHKLIESLALILQTLKPAFINLSIIKPTVALTSCILLSGFLFRDAFSYSARYTLADQKILLEDTINHPDTTCSFIALNAEEFYVLTEKQSTLRYTRMADWVDPLIEWIEPGGSDGFIKNLAETLPPVLIIRTKKGRKSVNLKRIKEELLSEYDMITVKAPGGKIDIYKKSD